MKSIIVLAVVLALVFYVGWPAYSGYEIKSALEAQDAGRLGAKIDFPSVRASLRPAVAAKVEKVLADASSQGGAANKTLLDQLGPQVTPRIIDAVLAVLVTPETLIRLHAQRANLKDAINAIVVEQVGQSGSIGGLFVGHGGATDAEGGLGSLGKVAERLGVDPGKVLGGLLGKKNGDKPPPKAAEEQRPAHDYGIHNIKHFGLNGPLGIALGLADDAKATVPDVTIEMSFVDGDWKLTGLVPRT